MSSEDSEVISVADDKMPSDIMPVLFSAMSKVPWKLLSFIFIIYIFLSSDVFINRILANASPNSVGFGGSTTTKGTIITGVLLVVFVSIVDLLIKRDVI